MEIWGNVKRESEKSWELNERGRVEKNLAGAYIIEVLQTPVTCCYTTI